MIKFKDIKPENRIQYFSKQEAQNVKFAREEELMGRKCAVFQATLLKEKVVTPAKASKDHIAFLAPMDEFCKNVELWDGVVVVLNHPKQFSANKTAVLNESFMGWVFNARRVDDKLVGDIFLDIGLNEASGDKRAELLEKAKNGFNVELSIGFFSDIEEIEKSIKFRGMHPYTAIFRNIDPNHLALLGEGIGACSIADGCGVNQFRGFGLEGGEYDEIEFNCCEDCKINSDETNLVNTITEAVLDKLGINIQMKKMKKSGEFAKKDLHSINNSANDSNIETNNKESVMNDDEDKKDGEVNAEALLKAMGLEGSDLEDIKFVAKSMQGFRSKIIETLSKNEKCPFSAEQLKSMDFETLSGMASMAGHSIGILQTQDASVDASQDASVTKDDDDEEGDNKSESEEKELKGKGNEKSNTKADEKPKEKKELKESNFAGQAGGDGDESSNDTYKLPTTDPIVSKFEKLGDNHFNTNQ